MFEKNDTTLPLARIIILIAFCLSLVFSLIIGIILAVKIYWAYCFLIFVGWLISWVNWVFCRLILSFFCDVKLIRNKLYNQENDNLEMFYKTADDENNSTENNGEVNNLATPLQQDAALNDSQEDNNDDSKNKIKKIITIVLVTVISLCLVAGLVFLGVGFYNANFN